MPADDGQILIIGAGPCGLGAAWRLNESGRGDWLLVERGPQPGGLAASFVDDNGFTWDIGGHVLFSHYGLFSGVVGDALAGEFIEHEREAWIHTLDRFVPYPFQYNIHRLPDTVRDECLAGLREAAQRAASMCSSERPDEHIPHAQGDESRCGPPKEDETRYPPGRTGEHRPGSHEGPANFGEWIDATFGAGIARHFMRPYNTKVWGRPPEEMGWRWIGERVAVPDVARVEENVRLGRDDAAWGPNNTFRFPATGGTGAIWRRLAAKLPPDKLRLSTEIAAVDIDARTCRTATGEELRYDHLISTMPLTELARRAGLDVPHLAATRAHILGLGLEGRPPETLRTKCWMYFPDPECPFYRATVFSNYSPQNVPAASPHWSLMFEVCVPEKADIGGLWDRTLASARNAGLIPDGAQIASRWSMFVPHAYPVPTLGRADAAAGLLPRLEAAGVLSRGRFGAWKYEVGNMDHSFMQGVEAADHILHGGEEVTLHHPEVVNKR